MPSSFGSSPDVMGSGHFPAVAYYYARNLYSEQKAAGDDVPIGMLHASWGGTSVEDWLDTETLDTEHGGSCRGPIRYGNCEGKTTYEHTGIIRPIQNVTIFGAITRVSPIPLRIVNVPIRQWHEGTLCSTGLDFPIGVQILLWVILEVRVLRGSYAP